MQVIATFIEGNFFRKIATGITGCHDFCIIDENNDHAIRRSGPRNNKTFLLSEEVVFWGTNREYRILRVARITGKLIADELIAGDILIALTIFAVLVNPKGNH
ncbi:hypothetical protein SDC9_121250 [bioreactor metagenome]|uniref:Uncharacterized protein n=1 Tax=bioreactor metagenome TaxID=1076179 RepID=A0A645CBG7_9ZZZZ